MGKDILTLGIYLQATGNRDLGKEEPTPTEAIQWNATIIAADIEANTILELDARIAEREKQLKQQLPPLKTP